jgi:acetyl-CoA C-acetyltransferase
VSGTSVEQCARVVSASRDAALDNPLASYGARLTVEDVLASAPLSLPLRKLDVAQPADGCVVAVLAAEEVVPQLKGQPVWVEGLSWFSDSPNLDSRDMEESAATRLAAEKAYAMADVRSPLDEIDVFEINDELSYQALQHCEALKLCAAGTAGHLWESGEFGPRGSIPINPSGGGLGVGHLIECSGGHKTLEVVNQLRGEAGRHQVPEAKTGLVQVWRGAPTTSCAVMILRAD